MNIVLDKSFLQGSSKNLIHEMCTQFQIVMIENLFMEILTTESENMVKCFNKFPKIDNPLALVPNTGPIMRYEIENDRPCSPIETQFRKERFKFNEDLAEGQFVFTKEQKDALAQWKKETNNYTAGFIEKAVVADGWFDGLSEYRPGRSAEPISEAMNMVSQNDEFIRRVYSELRDEIFSSNNVIWPDPSKIGKEWILFRHLQVHLLAAIEYIRKYGNEPKDVITKRLENDYLDLDYCTIATISDGLATRDNTMKTFFKLLCPDKALFS